MTVLTLAVALSSCAKAMNYSDPLGPRFTGGRGVVSDSDPDLRIVTFNIAYGRKIPRAIECLRDEPLTGADIVVLQEMHAPGAEEIATALDMHFVAYPSSARPGENDMGTAVLSPWPIESTEKLILPHKTRIMQRGRSATVATVRIDGRPVRVYSLHLGSPFGLSGRKRGEQAQAVIEDARQWGGPVIVAGDFNSRSVGKRFEAAGYDWPTKALRRTVGPFSFDHIFVRGLRTNMEASVARTCKGASDHYPVWALLRPAAQPQP